MRIGLYNRWLPILGGGERYSLELALALAGMAQVDLLTYEPPDPVLVERRLGLAIHPLGVRALPTTDWSAASEASAEYDLFINVSHGDLLPSQARHSWLVVFFPEPPLPGPLPQPHPFLWKGGYAEERDGRGRPFRWLAPEGALWLPPAGVREVALLLERPARGAVQLHLGERSTTVDLPAGRPTRVRLRLPADQPRDGMLLRWRADALPLEEQRVLALRLLAVEAGRRSWLPLRRATAVLPADRPDPGHALTTYQRLLAISEYVARWTLRHWGRRSDLLEPPVPQFEAGAKRPWILSVGRFFQGLHAKRQEVLIETFRLLHQRLPEWELHLAGGLDDSSAEHRDYVAGLARAAAGLPVRFHINAPGERLAQLYAGASCYWHAAGYGSDPERQPEAQEHFGISTVEAMSARCVPLVYGEGGPAEVVRDGVDGFHWRTPEELAQRTALLALDAELRQRMGASAGERATTYSSRAFAARAAGLLAELDASH